MFIALLRRQAVSIYRSESSAPLVINLPANLTANLEVKDQKGLADFLAGVLKSSNLVADEGVLLLSDEVIFAKNFANDVGEQTKIQVQAFLDLVPVGKRDFVSKEFVLSDKKWVCVSNRTLCISVVYGFGEAGLKITSVLPSFVVSVNEQTVFGMEKFQQVKAVLPDDKQYSMLPNIFAGEKKGWWKLW